MPVVNKDQALRVLQEFINKEVPRRVKDTGEQVARWALSKAISLSPYDTGNFIASWQISLSSDTANHDYAYGSRISRGAAEGEAVANSEPVIQEIKNSPLGTPWYIVNSIPYATYVEYGSPTTVAQYILPAVKRSVAAKFGGGLSSSLGSRS